MYESMKLYGFVEAVFSLDNNIILGTLDEFGGTIYTVTIAIKEIPSNIDFNFGMSYIESLATIGINIGGILDYVNYDIEFTRQLLTRYTFGGSYIGELYYNFGYFGVFFSSLIGLFVAKCSSYLENAMKSNDILSIGIGIMMMYSILIWTRSYCNILVRNIVWAVFLIYLVKLFFKKGK